MSDGTLKQTRRQLLTNSSGATGLYRVWHGTGRPACRAA